MTRFVEVADRGRLTLLPERLEDWIDDDNPVPAIDAFVMLSISATSMAAAFLPHVCRRHGLGNRLRYFHDLRAHDAVGRLMNMGAWACFVSTCLWSVFLITTARADALKDCNNREELDVRIKGCTTLIAGKKKLNRAGLIDAYLKRGEAYFHKMEDDPALADLNACLDLNPKDYGCWAFKALIHDRKMEVGEAIAAYTKSVELAPDEETRCATLLQRANAYHSKVLMETAQSVLAHEIQGRPAPKDESSLDSSYKRNLELAAADAAACIRINPAYEGAYAQRANYFYMLTRPKEAAVDAAKAVELNPKNIDAVAILAFSSYDDKDYARALELGQRWRELTPEDDKATEHIAKSLTALGRIDEAQALVKFAESTRRCRAAVDAIQQNKITSLDDGISACTAVIESKVVDKNALVTAYEYRAVLNAEKKNYDGAVADYTRCLEIGGGEGENVWA